MPHFDPYHSGPSATFDPGNERVCETCGMRNPVIERDAAIGVVEQRGWDCYEAQPCVPRQNEEAPDEWHH